MAYKKTGGGSDGKEEHSKESILDLFKYLEKQIRLKFAGGHKSSAELKGYDALRNLVYTVEYLRYSDEPYKLTEDSTRSLGLVLCRDITLWLICPQDGAESITNPYITEK